jgi:hypothetical protein
MVPRESCSCPIRGPGKSKGHRAKQPPCQAAKRGESESPKAAGPPRAGTISYLSLSYRVCLVIRLTPGQAHKVN